MTPAVVTPARFAWATGSPHRQRRILQVGAALFAVAVLWLAIAALAHPGPRWNMIDLQVYRWGGLMARQHQPVYDLRFEGFLSFTYTPLAVLTFEVLSFLSLAVLRYVITGLSLAALMGALYVAWGMAAAELREPGARLARWGLTLGTGGLALAFEPVGQTLAFGQINLLLLALVVADLARPDSRRTKGVGVGLAGAIKLTPLIFVGYLVFTRRFRAAAVAVATFVASVAVGFVVLPSGSHRFWLGRLFLDSQRVGGVDYVSNQSLNGALVRLAGSVAGGRAAWFVVAGLVGMGGLVLATLASRRGEELLAVLTVGLTSLLVSPISWSHHWVWVVLVVPCAAGLFAPLTGRALRGAWAGGAVLLVLFLNAPVRLIWHVPHYNDREYAWHGVQLLTGNGYVVIGLGLLVVLAWCLRRPVCERNPTTG